MNNDAYTPESVSIGPFHRGTPQLQAMEVHKLRYVKDFLTQEPEKNIEYYIKRLKEVEEKARQCYGELVSLSSDEFVEMMFFDGCFVIEFMLKSKDEKPSHDHDPLFSTSWMDLKGDLQILEKQLPFFVIEHLFDLINGLGQKFWDLSFLELTLDFFSDEVKMGRADLVTYHGYEVKHFVDLLRRCYVPMYPRISPKCDEDIQFIPSATELHKVGIKFEKGPSNCFLDVSFTKNGVLSIPPLLIAGGTEGRFRNLIAYEHFDEDPGYITSYTILMDSLIDTPEDVALLRSCGIINNWLGDNKEVSRLFNNLGVTVPTSFHFAALYEDVNAYYDKRWHEWQAKLKRDYFNTPWSTMSFVAAVILLLCTIIQAVCSIISVIGPPTV